MLTDIKLKKLEAKDGFVSDKAVKGLYYKASAKGSGKWILRFTSPGNGKRRDMGLGTYPETSIAMARKAAFSHRERIASGIDPIDEKQKNARIKAALANEMTFEQAANEVFKSISSGFQNAKHKAQWLSSLSDHIFPTLGRRKITDLTAKDFADALRPIWLEKAETASRVKQRCSAVMDWCVAQGMITASPVNVVAKLLPKQPSKSERTQHQPAVPWKDVPCVIASVCRGDNPSLSARALEFLILTAARSGEIRGMEWSEIDLDAKVWTIPATRMKTKNAHRVPLSSRAIEILKAQGSSRLHKTLVFPSARGKLLSDMALTKLLRDKKVKSGDAGRIATAHGFRSSFRDWASENGYARDLAEKALAHTIKNSTEAAYHRTDLLEQRRPMMEAWAEFIEK